MQFFSISYVLKPLTQIHSAFSGHLLLLLEPALVLEPLPVDIRKTQQVMVLGSFLCLPLLEQGSWTRNPPETPVSLIHSVVNPATTKLTFKPRPKSKTLSFDIRVEEEIVKAIGLF